jgi:hypothetical protein
MNRGQATETRLRGVRALTRVRLSFLSRTEYRMPGHNVSSGGSIAAPVRGLLSPSFTARPTSPQMCE